MVLSNIMTDLDGEDPLTKLNTQLNKSMVLMDTTTEGETNQPRRSKTIKINTKVQPASPGLSTPSPVSRKSILKKNDTRSRIQTPSTKTDREASNDTSHDGMSTNASSVPRPHNIDDLLRKQDLIVESADSTLNFDDISDDEDVWVMDIPTTIDPRELKGQTLVFGEKSKFKVKEERYCAVNHDVKCNITCVFNTGKEKSRYKTVNVKPVGAITIRRKLSGISKTKPMQIENSSVPFPENLKTRHPLFGVSYEKVKLKKGAIK